MQMIYLVTSGPGRRKEDTGASQGELDHALGRNMKPSGFNSRGWDMESSGAILDVGPREVNERT
jgi:hypothetical protein